MSLITNCNAITAATLDGWITTAGTTNQPMETKTGASVAVFIEASFTHFIVSTTTYVQEVEGIAEYDGSETGRHGGVLTKYQRVSSTRLGQTRGTDWTDWVKVS